jgi:hypothetical protein
MMGHSIPSPEKVVQIARTVLETRFAGASAALVAGSLMRGDGSTTSDIDLVVLYSELPQAWRETFVVEGVPVEAFVHDAATLRWFLREDIRSGRPALLGMLADSQVIGSEPQMATPWQAEARALLHQGPDALSAEQLDRLRYQITDKIDDLRGAKTSSDLLAIGTSLYEPLAELALRGRGSWAANGKWIPRLLVKLDAQLASEFEAAFHRLFRDQDASALIAFAEKELAQHGGPLLAGYRSDASAEWRIAAKAQFFDE